MSPQTFVAAISLALAAIQVIIAFANFFLACVQHRSRTERIHQQRLLVNEYQISTSCECDPIRPRDNYRIGAARLTAYLQILALHPPQHSRDAAHHAKRTKCSPCNNSQHVLRRAVVLEEEWMLDVESMVDMRSTLMCQRPSPGPIWYRLTASSFGKTQSIEGCRGLATAGLPQPLIVNVDGREF